MKKVFFLLSIFALSLNSAIAQVAGQNTPSNMVVVHNKQTTAIIVVSPRNDKAPIDIPAIAQSPAGTWEKQAALDLQKYIGLMSGAVPQIADTPETIAIALKSKAPLFLVGQIALQIDKELQSMLDKVAKKNPVLRDDAIAVKRIGNRVFLVGNNDESHYYAVSWLLQQWGCRWYLPTEFGEHVPTHSTLAIGNLNYAYAPPFETRMYWLSYFGDKSGTLMFQRQNFFNYARVPGTHAVGRYVKEIVPEGKNRFQIPYSNAKTIEHIVNQVEDKFAKGKDFSLGIDDGSYQSDDPLEEQLKAGLHDKYFMSPSMTEPFMVFYNSVAKILQDKHPQSKAKIGFLAYANLTIPPQRNIIAEKSLVAYLAAIDIDPNHHMDNPNSPSRQEYREMLYRWSQVMEGRIVIYDYDQGCLVWRDMPNPSFFVFQRDVQHYRKAGVLGIDTESRGAFATTFLNLYFRGQLMWNPDANVDNMLDEFYPNFYGPAARPMKAYWSAIYDAWKNTIVTEHEYYISPAIYTPALVTKLKNHLTRAQAMLKPLAGKQNLSRNERLYLERLKFTQLSFDVIENYVYMVQAAATQGDYAVAVKYGELGLKARDELKAMNPIFTTTKLEKGFAWWNGEVGQYRELDKLVNGEKGKSLTKLPQQWAFRRDPHDTGLASGWAQKPIDLGYWNANKNKLTLHNRKDYPATQWEMLDTGLYIQAQGVRFPDYQSYTGFGWYRTSFNLNADQAKGKLNLMFPGLFNEAWLYINGYLVGHRTFPDLWWNSDYKFEWDVDISDAIKAGENTITLRINNPHHPGGIFRRPFLYMPMEGTASGN